MTASSSFPVPRAAFYGITEIAASLDLDRQLVTVWRRRGSHAIPQPDAELSNGPIWKGDTIEPWIDAIRGGRDSGEAQKDLRPEEAMRACRRLLRCTALVLEYPVRATLLSRSLADAREIMPIVAEAVGPLADDVRGLLAVLEHRQGRAGLRDALLDTLPRLAEVAQRAAELKVDHGPRG